MYRDRYFKSPTMEALKVIEPVVKEHNLTLIETALRWCVHHSKLNMEKEKGGNDGIIIGVSSLKQLEGNIKDLEKGPLPKEVVEALDKAWEGIGGSCPNYWR
jgi:aflatoxin B1 aldehyde reductase